jgi:hypothetical protein
MECPCIVVKRKKRWQLQILLMSSRMWDDECESGVLTLPHDLCTGVVIFERTGMLHVRRF